MTTALQAMEGTIVVGALAYFTLIYSVCDLKAAQINKQRCLSHKTAQV